MAQLMYVTLTGVVQGAFKGQGTTANPGRIPIVYFDWESTSSFDPGSGALLGKRQHNPVVFRKAVDAASPQLLQTWSTNEVLRTALFEFTSVPTNGTEAVDYTITLTNSAVVSFKESVQVGQTGGPPVDSRRLEEVALTFQKIEIVHFAGEIQASDVWQANT